VLSARAAPAASPQAPAQASQFEKASTSASHASFSFSIVFGGYGHFGFEFFMPKASGPLSSAYFIELGTNGIGAKTNSGQSYLNGFAVSTGLRVYL
jgi:hypothetical protein